MNEPFYTVNSDWKNIQKGTIDNVIESMDKDVVILKDGIRYDKKSFCSVLSNVDCGSFTIDFMQVMLSEERVLQVSYEATYEPAIRNGSVIKNRILTTWITDDDNESKIITMCITTL